MMWRKNGGGASTAGGADLAGKARQQHGFRLLEPEPDDFAQWAGAEYSEMQAHCGCVQAYQQHRFVRNDQEKPIAFSSVDFSGTLCITDASLFEQALFSGLGKSKALGCGMLMVKRKR